MAFPVKTSILVIITALVILGNNYAAGQATIPIGQNCTGADSQCLGYPNSRCTGICSCISTHVPSLALDNCLPIRNQIGNPCQENQQCQRGTPGKDSECVGGSCRCQADFVHPPDEHECYRKAVQVGNACEKDVQCLENLKHAFCSTTGNCTCISDAVAGGNGTKCLLKMQLGGTCEEQGQCGHISNSICNQTDSKCGCRSVGNETFVPNPTHPQTQCMQLAESLGDSCEAHPSQCQSLRNSHCSGAPNKCQCSDNQVASLDNKSCLEKLTSLNASCLQNQQCQVTNSSCLSGTCRCSDGFVEGVVINNRCLPIRAKIGENCFESVQCAGQSYDGSVGCNDGQCRCPDSTEFYIDHCPVPRNLDAPCYTHNQCHAGVNNLTACVLQQDSNPPVKVCQCLPNTVKLHRTCWSTKVVGDECESTVECAVAISGPVVCEGATRKCTCLSEYKPHSTKLSCVAGNGGNALMFGFGVPVFSVFAVILSILVEKL